MVFTLQYKIDYLGFIYYLLSYAILPTIIYYNIVLSITSNVIKLIKVLLSITLLTVELIKYIDVGLY